MPTKSLIKKTRKPRNPFKVKVERELTHVNQDQALARHIYCIPGHYCDHPQDGWCRVGDYPTPQELEEINTRLSGGEPETPSQDEHPVKVKKTRQKRTGNPKTNQYFCMKCEDWHVEAVTQAIADGVDFYIDHMEFKRKRGQRLKSQLKPKAPAKYFCINCELWHFEDGPNRTYKAHLKFKRKRGRQPGWKKG